MKVAEGLEIIKRMAVQIVSVESLTEKLNSGKKLIIKLGCDPSRPDLHLGHSVVLRAMRVFQDLGHQVVFIIGDYTAMIGDPSGKNKTRPALTYEETRRNGETYFNQVIKILDKEKTRIAYNSEWLSGMTFADILKLCGNYTVARLLERDDFAKRYKENQPISMHEMMYPLMQGYDSVALQADVEIGGTDQTFNLLVGRELQKSYGQTPQEVITFPLLVGLDGKEKMSKSLDNYIGIYEEPATMFEKCMKVPDNVLMDYFRLTTEVDLQQAADMMKSNIIGAHIFYAKTIVTRYHSAQAAEEAHERYKQVASGVVPTQIAEFTTNKKECTVIELLMAAEMCSSNSEARRLVQGKGVKVNNATVEDFNAVFDTTKDIVISKGKNKFAKVTYKN